MLTATLFLVAALMTQVDAAGAEFTRHFYYAARLIGAILIATVVPLQIDRRARRSSRIGR